MSLILDMDEIAGALAESPRFDDVEEVLIAMLAIEYLPRVIAARRDQLITSETWPKLLFEVQQDFEAVATDELEAAFGPHCDWPLMLVLSPAAQVLYEQGALTLGQLLRLSPATFLPWPG